MVARHPRGGAACAAAAFILSAVAASGAIADVPREFTVAIENMGFFPAEIIVHRGACVVWVNRDLVPHTVSATGAFESGTIAAGAEWRQRLDVAGRYVYVCDFHPTMRAEVIVQ